MIVVMLDREILEVSSIDANSNKCLKVSYILYSIASSGAHNQSNDATEENTNDMI